ncbi:MAG: hypothetical protein IKA00_09840 [Prevotella sp.]|nr:hypothetical protein [Prevotella sp.]
MAKTKTAHAYELEIKKMIIERLGKFDRWLIPQVRATAMNMVMLDKLQDTLSDEDTDLMIMAPGSMGQMKQDAHPLLAHYDKLQRTLIQQFQALSLNYNATPSKVKESVKQGVDDEDPMAKYYQGKQ